MHGIVHSTSQDIFKTGFTDWCVVLMFHLSLYPPPPSLIHTFFGIFLQEGGDKEISQAILDERTRTVEAWHRGAAARAQYTKPAPPITCATFAQDVLEGRAKVSQGHEHKHQPLMFGPASLVGGNITSERERMAAQVFQPSHRCVCVFGLF